MIEMYSKSIVCQLVNAIPHNKSFCSDISRVLSFYARELNLVSKCRKMNKLYCEILKIRGKYGKKKEILRVEITDTRKSLQ